MSNSARHKEKRRRREKSPNKLGNLNASVNIKFRKQREQQGREQPSIISRITERILKGE